MHRRDLLAAAATAALLPRPSLAQAPSLATEEFMIPAGEPGIELFLRNKRPENLGIARPDRTLLFVHGTPFPSSTTFDLPLGGLSWMDYIAGRGFDVWCLDLRGHGRSSRPPEMAQPANANPPLVRTPVAVGDLGTAAEFIRRRRNLPKLTVMGWSFGTIVAARHAAENPNLVERAVLYAPPWLREGQVPPAPTEAWRGVTQASVRSNWTNGVPDAKRAALLPAGWFEHFAGLTWATDPDGLRQNPPVLRAPNGPIADILESYAKREPLYDPAKITAPTLLVVAEWDQATPPYMAQAIFPLLTGSPGKRLVLLAEGTHSMLMERNRGALFQAVQVFLEEAIG